MAIYLLPSPRLPQTHHSLQLKAASSIVYNGMIAIMSQHLLRSLRPLRASAIIFTNIVSACSGFLFWRQHQPHHLSLQRRRIHHHHHHHRFFPSGFINYPPTHSQRTVCIDASGRDHEFVDDTNVSSSIF